MRLSAPEASIKLSIIPLPRRPSLGNKTLFTSGSNAKVVIAKL
jgi:hypothetical protein